MKRIEIVTQLLAARMGTTWAQTPESIREVFDVAEEMMREEARRDSAYGQRPNPAPKSEAK